MKANKKATKRSTKRVIQSSRGKNSSRPDEYIKEGGVTIPRPLQMGETAKLADGKGGMLGHTALFDLTKEHYYVTVRRIDGPKQPFYIVVEHDGVEVVWPDEVFQRVAQYRDRIIAEQRSDRGKDRKVSTKEQEQEQERLLEDIDMTGI